MFKKNQKYFQQNTIEFEIQAQSYQNFKRFISKEKEFVGIC